MSVDYMAIAVNSARDKARRDLDPIQRELADEATADHSAAAIRGARIGVIAKRVAWELHAQGLLRCSHVEAERELKQALAEAMYPGAAVDL